MVVYDIGTSSDLVANTTPGLGHVLCVIPYRSNAELFSLANNHGPNVQTRIHASNYFVAKEIAANIKVNEAVKNILKWIDLFEHGIQSLEAFKRQSLLHQISGHVS